MGRKVCSIGHVWPQVPSILFLCLLQDVILMIEADLPAPFLSHASGKEESKRQYILFSEIPNTHIPLAELNHKSPLVKEAGSIPCMDSMLVCWTFSCTHTHTHKHTTFFMYCSLGVEGELHQDVYNNSDRGSMEFTKWNRTHIRGKGISMSWATPGNLRMMVLQIKRESRF